MRRIVLLCAGVALFFLGGCVLPKSDPAIIGRSERWYRHADPAAFFAHEQRRGRVYFVGIYEPAEGDDSPVPGISRDDPAYRVSMTWFVPTGADLDPRRNERFVAAARAFARRYNPLVLAYLRDKGK